MAKTPGTPKGKAAAPAQFDMNSRERKGGKGRPGGPGAGRGRDEKRPPSRIVSLAPALVDRGDGWVIQKIGRIDQASHVAVGVASSVPLITLVPVSAHHKAKTLAGRSERRARVRNRLLPRGCSTTGRIRPLGVGAVPGASRKWSSTVAARSILSVTSVMWSLLSSSVPVTDGTPHLTPAAASIVLFRGRSKMSFTFNLLLISPSLRKVLASVC